MKLKPPHRWNVAKNQFGYEWKHQTLPEDLIYTRSFYELKGRDGLIFFLEDRYGKRFTRKATEALSL